MYVGLGHIKGLSIRWKFLLICWTFKLKVFLKQKSSFFLTFISNSSSYWSTLSQQHTEIWPRNELKQMFSLYGNRNNQCKPQAFIRATSHLPRSRGGEGGRAASNPLGHTHSKCLLPRFRKVVALSTIPDGKQNERRRKLKTMTWHATWRIWDDGEDRENIQTVKQWLRCFSLHGKHFSTDRTRLYNQQEHLDGYFIVFLH